MKITSWNTRVWTLTRSTGLARLAFKMKRKNEKVEFSSFEKPALVRNGVVWSRHLLFIFIFKMGKIK